jgi:hypothetical protein
MKRTIGLLTIVLVVGWSACGGDDDSKKTGTQAGGAGAAGGSGGSGGSGAGGGAGDVCGDGVCQPSEGCDLCADDCGSCCGDDVCGANELCGTCAADCGVCAGNVINVVRGPYLQTGTPDAVVVRWRTDVPTTSAVAFGFAVDQLNQVAQSAESTTEHVVQLTGLVPDTQFYYAIGAQDSELTGFGDDSYKVLTAPPTGTARATRIWAIGDAGTANSNAAAVRDAYLAFTGTRGTDLWLMLGDNAYNDGTDSEYQAAVFDMYPSVLRSSVVWSTLGNHDGHSATSSDEMGPYYDIFTLPRAAEAGGTASGTEAYYSFDYGTIHFVCLDSYDSDTDPTGDMMTWMENDLTANAQPWLVAFWHHPPYTKGSHDSDTEGGLGDMREYALPILESYGVDLVLSGHSHSYERSMFLNGHYGYSSSLDMSMIIDGGDGNPSGDGAYTRAPGSAAGAVYIVAGSSGKTNSVQQHPAMHIWLPELGSVVMDVDGLQMDVNFIDDAGAQLDFFSIIKM